MPPSASPSARRCSQSWASFDFSPDADERLKCSHADGSVCTRCSVKRARDCDLQLLTWQQWHSERPDLAARDLHLVPVELSHDEAVEALVVGAAIIAQETERSPTKRPRALSER